MPILEFCFCFLQDFDNDPKLLHLTTDFLEELIHNNTLLPAETKAASQLLQMISKQDQDKQTVDLDLLLATPLVTRFYIKREILYQLIKKFPSVFHFMFVFS